MGGPGSSDVWTIMQRPNITTGPKVSSKSGRSVAGNVLDPDGRMQFTTGRVSVHIYLGLQKETSCRFLRQSPVYLQ